MNEEMVNKTQGSYAHLMQGLMKQYPGLAENGKSKLFQFMETPKDATWSKQTDYALCQLMDAVPAERGGYYTASENRVSSSYRSLVTSLCNVQLKKSAEYNDLTNDLQTKDNLLLSQRETLKSVYTTESGETFTAKGFQEWLGTLNLHNPFLPGEVKAYLEVSKERDSLYEKREHLANRLTSDYRRILTALDDPANQISVVPDGQTSPVILPRMSLSGNLASDVARWTQSDKDAVQIHINSEDTIESETKSIYASSAHKIGWSAGAVHDGEFTQQIADEKYQLDINIRGINTYDILRDGWYNGQYVNPDLDIDASALLNKKSYFGEGGALQLIPVSLLVVYKPSIKLTITRDVYERKVRDFIHVNPFLCLFGWGLNVGTVVTKSLIAKDDIIEIPFETPTNAAPQIIGITSVKKYLL